MSSSNVPQYPAMFDPSQMTNKYSTMNSSSFPMYNYYGVPTDAQGNPISSYKAPVAPPAPVPTPGTSINSRPTGTIYDNPDLQGSQGVTAINQLLGGQGGYGNQNQNSAAGLALLMGLDPSRINGLGSGANSGSSNMNVTGSASPSDPGFAYLLAQAHPDKVVTPGITPPPRASQPGNFNLDSLIANMRANAVTAPPGGYATGATGLAGGGGVAPSSSFLNTLAALRAGSPGAK